MARNRKGKKEKRKIFILVEGETEQKYFDFLRQRLRLSNVKIKTVVLENSGQTWIEKAKRLVQNDFNFRRDRTTEIFVVFDKDEFSNQDLQKMFQRAKDEAFEVGFSNLTFEVWLLAHFEEITPRLYSKSVLKNKLSRHLQTDYVKADTEQLEKMIKNVDQAVKNAGGISKIDFDYQSTNIGALIMKIKS
ncbi:RloB family protein [Ohessyouella blattaphilus]|uniref:RloB family protein n=1 Tax=Ohessyouella blattaphilus TaxID=2949333 RepID=A0ABT1EIJ2_9FIRM|nr:RloB family protein [Ohessyouella blattaphilus]MCP1110510.1 RloB family protein [Ohessyouella blattaphilus]MCR8563904.1 RloB family protein [Ohessyouella blattaphilus]MDL2249492.1 RloB family protein [Lachnospiraceae bacterium OttesenSCG-928-J05]